RQSIQILRHFIPTRHSRSTLSPYTTLFRSSCHRNVRQGTDACGDRQEGTGENRRRLFILLPLRKRFARVVRIDPLCPWAQGAVQDRKSTRLNSSHVKISYAVFCLKTKTKIE